ncbi:response regulator [bacterium]|nr:response regulator [bacterium]
MTIFRQLKPVFTPHLLTEEFDRLRLRTVNQAVSLGALLCAILVPFFTILDIVLKPEWFGTFLLLRLSVTAFSVLIYFISRNAKGIKYAYTLAVTQLFVVSVGITLMCHLDQGPVDPYYAGINLPVLGFGIMMPLTILELGAAFGLVWFFYFLPNVFVVRPDEIPIFVNNNFFLISTMIISFAGSRFNFIHQKNQFRSRRRLQAAHGQIKEHAINLEEEVQERTQKLLQSERLAVVGQLAGGIAHDFNNILTSILGIAELMMHSLAPKDPMREDVDMISRVSKKATNLVKQLLAFSREQVMSPECIDINEVVRDVDKMLQYLIGEQVELKIIPSPEIGHIMADPVQVEQIVLNLVVNARDAMPDGGRCIIETGLLDLDHLYCREKGLSVPPGEYVVLICSDTGTGMDEVTRSKIFEPFFTTKEKGRGTGLGLSTVYGIVKQSKGDIFVYSEPGRGTSFKIFFPKLPDTESIPEKERSYEPQLTLPAIGRAETILLVEDDDDVRDTTARILEDQGYRVLQAKDGHQAVILSREWDQEINLLISDLVIPHIEGQELAGILMSERSEMKVLFVSGFTEAMVSEQLLLHPDTHFLQKPYSLENLNRKIRYLLEDIIDIAPGCIDTLERPTPLAY